MSDFRLDSAGDLIWIGSNPALVRGLDALAQRLAIKLRTFLGEWFLDATAGVPYLTEVPRKPFRPEVLGSLIRRRILETEGVKEILGFRLDFEPTGRVAKVQFVVSTDLGILDDVVTLYDRPEIVPVSRAAVTGVAMQIEYVLPLSAMVAQAGAQIEYTLLLDGQAISQAGAQLEYAPEKRAEISAAMVQIEYSGFQGMEWEDRPDMEWEDRTGFEWKNR